MRFVDNEVVHRALGPAFREHRYSTWNQLSLGVSYASAAVMVLEHQQLRGRAYERVLFARPDVVIVADLKFHGPWTPPLDDVVYVECKKKPRGLLFARQW
eukprot:144883-Prymnesium_polylepis.1